mgnify:CR=1 FL=1|jgi:hypothetical protein
MSIDRRNLFYTRIEDLLKAELGLPEELLRETLNPFFDQIAVSVWSLGDVFTQAKRMGWPMSFDAGLHILSIIENRDSPGENGITWDTLFEAIEAWASGMNWEEITEKSELESLEGDFILLCEPEDAIHIQNYYQSSDLYELLNQARQLAHLHAGTPVQIYCVDPEKAEKPIEIGLRGNLLRRLLFEKESAALE